MRPTPRRTTTSRCARRSCGTSRWRWRRCGEWSTSCRSARSTASIWRSMRLMAAISRLAEQEARVAEELGSRWGVFALAFAQLGAGTSRFRRPKLTRDSERSTSWAPHRWRPAWATWRSMKAASRMPCEYSRRRCRRRGVQESRPRRCQARHARACATASRTEEPRRLPRPNVRWRTATPRRSDSSRPESLWRLARLRKARDAGSRPRIRAAGRASGLCQDHRRRDRAARTEIRARPSRSLTEANTLLDTWIGRFDLGRAYLEAGLFTQADSEFDRCIKRRGEALSLFLDEEPTFGFFPSVYYYQGRVREALKSGGLCRVVPHLSQHSRERRAKTRCFRDVRKRAGV